jgi:signal transduction histidine kinase
MKAANINVTINGPDDFKYHAWQQDIYAIFTNLIDNSIYWIREKRCKKRDILINIVLSDDNLLYIDYQDSGPGIESDLISSEVIFEPDFSTKPNGTGLGLAIAGEAALRNNLDLRVCESDRGAYFRLQPKQNMEARK